MTPVEALEFAMQKEVEAMEAYRKYADDFPMVRDTFLFLMSEEYKHKELISKKILEITT